MRLCGDAKAAGGGIRSGLRADHATAGRRMSPNRVCSPAKRVQEIPWGAISTYPARAGRIAVETSALLPNSSAMLLSLSHATGSLLPRQIASRDFHSPVKAATLVESASAAGGSLAKPAMARRKQHCSDEPVQRAITLHGVLDLPAYLHAGRYRPCAAIGCQPSTLDR